MRNRPAARIHQPVHLAAHCGVCCRSWCPVEAKAHVTLAGPNAAPGATRRPFPRRPWLRRQAHHALTVTIPPGVSQVRRKRRRAGRIATVREGGRTTAVTWKGGALPADKPGTFTAAMTLPATGTQLVFPAHADVRRGRGRTGTKCRWPGMAMKHPAPMLVLAAAAPTAAAGLGGERRLVPRLARHAAGGRLFHLAQ